MAGWEKSTNSDFHYAEQWDVLIGPIRWYRWSNAPQGAYQYCFVVEDGAQPHDASLEDDALEWKTADFWGGEWPSSGTLWDAGLLAEPVGPPIDVRAVDEQQSVDGGAEQVPALAGTRLADPTVASGAAPQYAPRGSYAWPVRMTVTDVLTDRWSWIVQKVVIADGAINATFWEAFPVAPGAAEAQHQDIYQGGPARGATSGTVRIVGLMQHHAFDVELPPDMGYGGSDLADEAQVTSTSKPRFWLDDDGAQHDLTFEWANSATEDTLVSFDTVPDGGEPVFKDHHTKLSHG